MLKNYNKVLKSFFAKTNSNIIIYSIIYTCKAILLMQEETGNHCITIIKMFCITKTIATLIGFQNLSVMIIRRCEWQVTKLKTNLVCIEMAGHFLQKTDKKSVCF